MTIFTNIVTGFILFPLIVNNMGTEVLAIFGLLFSMLSIFDIVSQWFNASISKSLHKYKYLTKKLRLLSFLIM